MLIFENGKWSHLQESLSSCMEKRCHIKCSFISSVRSSSGYHGLIEIRSAAAATHFFKFFRLTNESKDNILLWDHLSANEEADNKISIVQRVYNWTRVMFKESKQVYGNLNEAFMSWKIDSTDWHCSLSCVFFYDI